MTEKIFCLSEKTRRTVRERGSIKTARDTRYYARGKRADRIREAEIQAERLQAVHFVEKRGTRHDAEWREICDSDNHFRTRGGEE